MLLLHCLICVYLVFVSLSLFLSLSLRNLSCRWSLRHRSSTSRTWNIKITSIPGGLLLLVGQSLFLPSCVSLFMLDTCCWKQRDPFKRYDNHHDLFCLKSFVSSCCITFVVNPFSWSWSFSWSGFCFPHFECLFWEDIVLDWQLNDTLFVISWQRLIETCTPEVQPQDRQQNVHVWQQQADQQEQE